MAKAIGAVELLSKLAPDSLQIFTERRMVRLDEKTNPEVEQTYLTVNGTPEGFRWLAQQLTQMANSAEKSECGNSVIVSPRDLKQLTMTEWSSIDLGCRRRHGASNGALS